jgi:hypothetical protein
MAEPLSRIAQVVDVAAEICVAVLSAGRCAYTGETDEVVELSPKLPNEFMPQHAIE